MALQISMAAFFLSPICQMGAGEVEELKGLSRILNWWRKVVKEKRGNGRNEGKERRREEGRRKRILSVVSSTSCEGA